MAKPSYLDYARISAAIYEPNGRIVTGGFRRTTFTADSNTGFQGGIFVRANEAGGTDYVVAFTGTQPTDDMGSDVIADIGFGGVVTRAASILLPVILPGSGHLIGAFLGRGPAALEAQLTFAGRIAGQASASASNLPGSRVFLTGHSLGGGLAQIVAARTGISAVAISAPAVTAVSGVTADYARTQPSIFCLRIQNDPINHTERVGNRLGTTVPLASPRTGGAAHSIDETAKELQPGGRFSSVGSVVPPI